MKKTLLFLTILFLTTLLSAQQTFINQGFENGLPENWTVYNEDGNENQWELINQSFWAPTGDNAIGVETSPDANDWLVSPQIYLQENYILSFCATEIIEGAEENITVWLSVAGNASSDFSINLSEITVPYLGYNDDGYLHTQYRIDLTAYKDQYVYIAWQLNAPTQDGLCLIDNITTEYTAENIEWSNILSSSWNKSISTVSDGGYITAGNYDSNIAIQKLTYNGIVEWTTYTSTINAGNSAHSIVETFDDENNPSGFIITGELGGAGNFSMLIWVCKYDTEGNLEWEKDFGITGEQNQGNSVKQTNDGGYIITGYEGMTDTQIILIKLNKDGNTEWIKKFGNTSIDFASDVIQTADGGYAITGFYKEPISSEGATLILKTDKDGNEEFVAEFPATDFARADRICQTTDGGFILAAFSPENSRDWRIIKADNRGYIEWEYIDGGSQEDIPSSVLQTAEGNYIIAGYKTVNDSQRMWIVKLNSNGVLIDETEYETSTEQARINDIKQTHDGAYIFTGVTTAFSDNVDSFIIKTIPDETEISQNDILHFILAEQTQDAEIDNLNHTITITVSEETDITALTPVIYTSAQSQIFPRSAMTQNFSQDFIYTVTALDQTQQEWTIIVENETSNIDHIYKPIAIYPNPSSGIFTITNNEYEISNVEITNITGKIIYKLRIKNQESRILIDISNQPNGIYFLSAETKNGIYSEKIIVN